MQTKRSAHQNSAGFSLIELMIAMAVTLIVMAIASSLLAQSLNVRARENARTEAVADAQRALNSMTREIANAGLGLTSNGLVASDCDNLQIRIRTNLNAFNGDTDTLDPDEDVVYASIINNTGGNLQRLVTRQDINSGNAVSQVANRVFDISIQYVNAAGAVLAAGQANQAAKVRLTVNVDLPAVGSPGSPGFQPASRTQVMSEVTLRNWDLVNF